MKEDRKRRRIDEGKKVKQNKSNAEDPEVQTNIPPVQLPVRQLVHSGAASSSTVHIRIDGSCLNQGSKLKHPRTGVGPNFPEFESRDLSEPVFGAQTKHWGIIDGMFEGAAAPCHPQRTCVFTQI